MMQNSDVLKVLPVDTKIKVAIPNESTKRMDFSEADLVVSPLDTLHYA